VICPVPTTPVIAGWNGLLAGKAAFGTHHFQAILVECRVATGWIQIAYLVDAGMAAVRHTGAVQRGTASGDDLEPDRSHPSILCILCKKCSNLLIVSA
jgi:hypothetical protein